MKYTLTRRGKIVPVKPMPPKEQRLHKNCVQWFDIQYPKLQQLLFHIPNGAAMIKQKVKGKMAPVQAMEMKRMGLRAGVADLFLSVPNDYYHGMYIELKRELENGRAGDQSIAQERFMNSVRGLKYHYVVVHTLDLFMAEVQHYLSTTPHYRPTWRQLAARPVISQPKPGTPVNQPAPGDAGKK